MMNQIPEREEDPSFATMRNPGASIMNPFQTTAFNKKEFQVTTTAPQPIYANQSQMPEKNYMETMHKQYMLKEVCEIPYVQLCDEDEKILFDISVQLKFGDFKNILNATQKI
jgi:hypothetical protein